MKNRYHISPQQSRILVRAMALAIAAIIALPVFAQTEALTERPGRVTFSNQVSRILQESCQQCHRPGQGTPMSLLTYEEARPWAKAIRKKVSSREMPPWHANPEYGEFINDRSLTQEEIDTIVRWVDTGAGRGNPEDLPAPILFTDGWTIGEPDLVLSMSRPYTVRASGRDTFEYFNIDTRMAEDRFVSAVEIMPGDRRVVHHAMCYVHQNDNFDFRDENSWAQSIGNGGTMLIEYGVGNKGDIFPPGTGRLLKKGSRLLLQNHYHPYGEKTTDVTKIGLRFHPRDTVHRRVISRWIGDQNLSIPPNRKDVPSRSSHTFRKAVNIISFQPHMHCRGQAMRAEAFYPNGDHEILCDVPNFDFNWQTTYIFTTPPYLPAGSRLVVTAKHDNTAGNPNNPNPNAYVRWGQSTFDEMMHGWTDFVYADEDNVRPTPNAARTTIRAESTTFTSDVDSSTENAEELLQEPIETALQAPRQLRHGAQPLVIRDSSVRTQPARIPLFLILGMSISILCLGLILVYRRR